MLYRISPAQKANAVPDRWPAGSPESKGGKFKPEEGGGGGQPAGKQPSKRLENKTLTHAEKVEAKKFLEGPPIVAVHSGVIKAELGKSFIEAAKTWVNEHNVGNIRRDDIGEIIFDANGVQDSLNHGSIGPNKLDAIQAIPEVIKEGKILEISDDRNGKPQKNVIIAAPIQIGTDTRILAVRLRQNIGDDTRFYIHQIHDVSKVISLGSAGLKTLGTDKSASPQGNTPQRSILNLLYDILSVNTEKSNTIIVHRVQKPDIKTQIENAVKEFFEDYEPEETRLARGRERYSLRRAV